MAFADLNPLYALWQRHGLDCLLMPEDVNAFTHEPAKQSAPAPASPSGAAQPPPAGASCRAREPHPARRKETSRQSGQAGQTRPPLARHSGNAEDSMDGENWLPLPPHAWPGPWREHLDSVKPGLVLWTYWNLGQDLCDSQAEGRAGRRVFLRRLLTDLGHPAGTHTFWPACLPDCPSAGEYLPNADVFWSGARRLGARGVVVMGSAAAKALGLPGGLRPLQQTRHYGHLVWVLWDVDYLLHEDQRYAAMLAFLRQALRQVTR